MAKIGILTWNTAWRRPHSPAGLKFKDILKKFDPHLVCLTETYADFFTEGHTVCSDLDYGYVAKQERRKVLIWSKTPWHGVDAVGCPAMPSGRFASACTNIEGLQIRFVGVCVPWRSAHVTTGRRDKRHWEDHEKYLDGLSEYMEEAVLKNLCIAGDFNQTIPKTRQPSVVYEKLMGCLKGFRIHEGNIDPAAASSIDHIIATPDMMVVRHEIISAIQDGIRLSDHDGLYKEFLVEK